MLIFANWPVYAIHFRKLGNFVEDLESLTTNLESLTTKFQPLTPFWSYSKNFPLRRAEKLRGLAQLIKYAFV